jgi:hypothetical protein
LPRTDQAAFFHEMRKAYGTYEFAVSEGHVTKGWA